MDHALLFGGTWFLDFGIQFTLGMPSQYDVDLSNKTLRENTAEPKRAFGAHKIATVLRRNGWDVEVFDFMTSYTLEELQRIAAAKINKNTKFIGFSVFTLIKSVSAVETLNEFVEWLKKEYPHIPTVAGGQHYGSTRCVNAEYHVVGFGELAILEFVQFIQGRGRILNWQKTADGHMMLKANEHHPAFFQDSMRIIYEERDHIEPHETLLIELSRGCKFKCMFCTTPKRGVQEDMTRPADDLRQELLDNYNRWGTTNYYYADETVNDSTYKLKKFGDVFAEMPFEPYTTGFTRADLLSARPEDIPHMLNMGYRGHFYGVESFNHASAKFCRKGMNSERIQDTLLRTREIFGGDENYRGCISLILGLPHETMETLNETKDWIVNNWQGQHSVFYPLYINEDPNKEDYYSGGSELSELSGDIGKHGYTNMRSKLYEPGYIEENWREDQHQAVRDLRDHFEGTIWERPVEGLNMVDMMLMKEEVWRKEYSADLQGVGPFLMHQWTAVGKHVKDVSHLRGWMNQVPSREDVGDYIRNYKYKKLYEIP